MTIRALCTDIDGTLLDSRRQLAERTVRTIRSLPDDVPVILASSRMPAAMRHLESELGLSRHPMICYNGGYILYFENGRLGEAVPHVLDSVTIPLEHCRTISRLAADTELHVSLYSEDRWYAPAYDKWTEREERITKASPQLAANADVLDDWQQRGAGAHKVMCMGPADHLEALITAIDAACPGALHLYRSKSTYLEIAPRKISKATALEQLLRKRYDISMAEVMAFGDNYNDIDLLKAVGVGVAVGNARDEVKAVANVIAESNIDDGVAITIEKYFQRP